MVRWMKTRTVFVLIFLLITATVVTFLCLQQQAITGWSNLLSETEKHLNNLKKLNEEPGLRKIAEAEKYLKLLGLDKIDWERWTDNINLKRQPLILIPAASGQGSDVIGLVESINRYLPFYSVLVYDLGMGYFERGSVRAVCNMTSSQLPSPGVCFTKEFVWSDYPSHVQVMDYAAYRPIIIQEVLKKWGSVLYLSGNHRIVSSDIKATIGRAKSKGLVGWTMHESTSAITHYKLFAFFHAKADNFYFHRTINPNRLLIYNTKFMHEKVMQPWVQCAVTYRCVSPIGAQNTGCRTNRKPLYLYSGCHGYDWSVLNVVLGLAFNYDSTRYSQLDTFFVNDPSKVKSYEASHSVTPIA